MKPIEELLFQAKEAIQGDRPEEAVAILQGIETKEVRDTAVHQAIADLCEEVGLIDRLILELNLALRDAPEEVAILKRLAVVHQDSGNLERAARCWRQLLKLLPQEPEAYRELGAILEEMRDIEGAREIYRQALEITGAGEFQGLIKALKLPTTSTEGLSEEESAGPSLLPTDAQLVRFLTLFSGREGVYARQWASPTGESGYTPIREPLTLAVVRNHLLGNHTVGVYLLRVDDTVNFVAFDIDVPKYILSRSISDAALWEKALKGVHRVACRLVDAGAAHGIPVYLEDSGFKGRHVWIFLDQPLPAKVAKRFAALLLAQLGPLPPEVNLELFPKQTAIKGEGLGNLIKLPLGIHRRSGRRSQFLTPQGEPLPDPLGTLEEIQTIPKRDVFAFLQRFSPAPGGQPETPGVAGKGEEIVETTRGAREGAPAERPPWMPGPVAEEYDLERDEEVQYLMLKCEVIRHLVEQANQHQELSGEEQIVLTYTLGHLAHGVEAVNTLLRRSLVAPESSFLKSRLRGNPISCPKIRSRIPQVTSRVGCKCNFGSKPNTYPNPLLHLQSLHQGGSGGAIGQGVDSLQFQTLIQEYLKARRQLTEVNLLLEKYQNRLDDYFQQAGIETVSTSFGTLRRAVAPDGSVGYTLEI